MKDKEKNEDNMTSDQSSEEPRSMQAASDVDDVEVSFGPKKQKAVKNLKESPLILEDIEVIRPPEMEHVVMADERLRVSPCTSPPYKWICYLEIYAGNDRYKGTGFFCTALRGTSRDLVILTCAHNLFIEGAYVQKVKVYPGRDTWQLPYGHFTVYPSSFRASDLYMRNITSGSRDASVHDYGAIFVSDTNRVRAALPRDSYGFGYNLLPDEALQNRVVNICGYPGDKSDGTLWIGGGRISRARDRMFDYDTDTAGGQSGSPVWTWYYQDWVVIGIHGYGRGTYNSARRINKEVLNDVFKWSREISRLGALSAESAPKENPLPAVLATPLSTDATDARFKPTRAKKETTV